jgi:hypothetical protein
VQFNAEEGNDAFAAMLSPNAKLTPNGSPLLSASSRGASGIVRALLILAVHYWKFADLSGAVLDKTTSPGMLPGVARTRIRF